MVQAWRRAIAASPFLALALGTPGCNASSGGITAAAAFGAGAAAGLILLRFQKGRRRVLPLEASVAPARQTPLLPTPAEDRQLREILDNLQLLAVFLDASGRVT